jgi:hypothetical protein
MRYQPIVNTKQFVCLQGGRTCLGTLVKNYSINIPETFMSANKSKKTALFIEKPVSSL